MRSLLILLVADAPPLPQVARENLVYLLRDPRLRAQGLAINASLPPWQRLDPALYPARRWGGAVYCQKMMFSFQRVWINEALLAHQVQRPWSETWVK